MARARELGVTATFLGADSWSLLRDYPPQAGESYFTDLWAPDVPAARVHGFIDSYRRRQDLEPVTAAATAYDAVSILAEVIRRQDRADSEAIRDGLASGSFSGVTGTIEFSGSGDPRRSTLIRRIDRQGRKVVHRVAHP